MTLPRCCLDCGAPAPITLVCTPCWQARLAVDGDQALAHLTHDAQDACPTANLTGKPPKGPTIQRGTLWD